MRAIVLNRPGTPLLPVEHPGPEPGLGEVLVKVVPCGVYRTDLHVVDGDSTEPKLSIAPGHEIVGTVAALGERVGRSVANLARRDAEEFLALAPEVPVRTSVELFPLAQANAALDALRASCLKGAAVLVP